MNTEFRMMQKIQKLLLLSAVASLGLAGNSGAQTITLTAPVSTQAVKEGDDFFALQMNNRLDFDRRRDFMWEEGWTESTIGAASGLWSGKTAGRDGDVYPLWPGFRTSLNSGLVGARFPVDSTKYTYLAAKRKLSTSSLSSKGIYWGHDVNFPPATAATKRIDDDGYFLPNSGTVQRFAANAWRLDNYDFRGSDTQSLDWRGSTVRAIRLDPIIGNDLSPTVSYDWVRLVDPTSTDTLSINWTTASVPAGGFAECGVSGNPNGAQVHVYVDTTNSGFNGAFITRVNYSANTYSFPLAALEPGTYYFYVELWRNCAVSGTTADVKLSTSAYSAAITINARPMLTVDNPSMTTGPDYATDVVKNPWDFNDKTDIANYPPANTQTQRQWKNDTFTNPVGAFTATAEKPIPPANDTDAQVWLNVPASNPINTKKYRYFTWDWSTDATNYTDISDKVNRGWVARAIWYNAGIAEDGSDAEGEITYEGQNTYTVDLTQSDILDVSDTFAKQSGWLGNPFISTFRFDPMEAPIETNFTIYDIKLRGRPEPVASSDATNNTFTIQATVTDAENDNVTVQFFSDTNNTGFDGTLLGTVASSAPGVKTLVRNMGTTFPQDFWIYVVVTDSVGSITRRYGDAPLHVAPQLWQPFFAVDTLETPFVGDFTGDGKTDIITFARQNPSAFGDVFVAKSNGSVFVDAAGSQGNSDKWHDFFAINTSEQVVIGDFNKDGKDDIGTWLSTTSRQVYVALSTGTGMTGEIVWANSIGSASTDLVFAGDADGDGRADLICFARTEGKVYVAISDGTKFGTPTVWHPFFAVSTFERPRVADINGDGKSDIVTFATNSPTSFGDVYAATSNGLRFQDSSGLQNSDKFHDFFAVSPTEEVRIGDINGDGKDDFFTFLPSPFGQVYVVQSLGTAMGPNVLWMSEEGVMRSTDTPFVGDVTGDGKADIIFFHKVPGQVRVVRTP